jgi:hypothetical protein
MPLGFAHGLAILWERHGETVWASIAAVIITLVIGFIFYWLTVRPKRFGGDVLAQNPIISAPHEARGSLEVFFKTEEDDKGEEKREKLESPNLIVVRRGNPGRQNILPTEFDKPISIGFGEARLLSVTQVPIVEDASSDAQKDVEKHRFSYDLTREPWPKDQTEDDHAKGIHRPANHHRRSTRASKRRCPF